MSRRLIGLALCAVVLAIAGCRLSVSIDGPDAKAPIDAFVVQNTVPAGGIAILQVDGGLTGTDTLLKGTLGTTSVPVHRIDDTTLAFAVPKTMPPGSPAFSLQSGRHPIAATISVSVPLVVANPAKYLDDFLAATYVNASIAAAGPIPATVLDTTAWRASIRQTASNLATARRQVATLSATDRAALAQFLATIANASGVPSGASFERGGLQRTSFERTSFSAFSAQQEPCEDIQAAMAADLYQYGLRVIAVLAGAALAPELLAIGPALEPLMQTIAGAFVVNLTLNFATDVSVAAILCGQPIGLGLDTPTPDAANGIVRGHGPVRPPLQANVQRLARPASAATVTFARQGAVASGVNVTTMSLSRQDVGTPIGASIESYAGKLQVIASVLRTLGLFSGAVPPRLSEIATGVRHTDGVDANRVTVANVQPSSVTLTASAVGGNLILQADSPDTNAVPFTFDILYTKPSWPTVRTTISAVLAAKKAVPSTVVASIPSSLSGIRFDGPVATPDGKPGIGHYLACIVPLSGVGEGSAKWGGLTLTVTTDDGSLSTSLPASVLTPVGDLRAGQTQYFYVAGMWGEDPEDPDASYFTAYPFQASLSVSYVRTGAKTAIAQLLNVSCN